MFLLVFFFHYDLPLTIDLKSIAVTKFLVLSDNSASFLGSGYGNCHSPKYCANEFF